MGIIRRKRFCAAVVTQPENIDLIDTPEKLLRFAESKSVTVVPLDVYSLAIKLGIEVSYENLENDLSGVLYKDDDTGRWGMKVNSNHHPNRQRYTIAHELGHYCLHRYFNNLFEDEIFFRGGKTSKTEWQANDFANAILMPEEIFRRKVRGGVEKVEELAKIFQVSSLALRIRVKALGMSGHGL